METSPLRIAETREDGHDGLSLAAGGPRVMVTTDVGPRILSLTLPDGTGEGLLASVPRLAIDLPDGLGRFRMHGGHRLWHAPEMPRTTYLPDDAPVEVIRLGTSVAFAHLQPLTGTRRTITVGPDSDSVMVDHTLTNEGPVPMRLSPWAITMLTPGGEAWLPRSLQAADDAGVQANGSLALWPYTRLTDDRLVFGDPIIRIRAVAGSEGRVKIGLQGQPGWVAYRLDEAVLVKRFTVVAGAAYPDLGSAVQCYSCGDFIELETLGPLTTIEPGGSVTHRETWSLHRVDATWPMDQVMAALDLD